MNALLAILTVLHHVNSHVSGAELNPEEMRLYRHGFEAALRAVALATGLDPVFDRGEMWLEEARRHVDLVVIGGAPAGERRGSGLRTW